MSLQLTILGCNSAIPTIERFTTAQVLQSESKGYIIDCGEGIQIRLNELKIKRSKISEVFISHLHGDHFFGLPGLLTSFNLSGRTQPLHIFGPKGLMQYVQTLKDIGSFYLNYELMINELDAEKYQIIFEDEQFEVYSLPLKHRVPTTGFVFKEKEKAPNIIPWKIQKHLLTVEEILSLKGGNKVVRNSGEILIPEEFTVIKTKPRTYAYCSDTIYDESLIPFIEGADLLYHESTYLHELKDKAHERMHSTSKEAALIAKKANVKKLILGHYSMRYKNIQLLVDEAKEIFENVEPAFDGKSIPF